MDIDDEVGDNQTLEINCEKLKHDEIDGTRDDGRDVKKSVGLRKRRGNGVMWDTMQKGIRLMLVTRTPCPRPRWGSEIAPIPSRSRMP